MKRFRSYCGRVAVVLLVLLAPLRIALPAGASTIVIDTNAGTLGGQGVGRNFRGARIVRALLDQTGVATFYLKGDLTFLSTDTVVSAGNHPILLVVSNNVTIPQGTTFDFSAVGTTPGPGGGAPGITGGAAGGGGLGGPSGSPNGGRGGYNCGGANAFDGECGLPGSPGVSGGAGQPGSPGGDGFGNPASGGMGGRAGAGGMGAYGGYGGYGGHGGGGHGNSGCTGGVGSVGEAGEPGGNGFGGVNDLMGWMLSAGGAGGQGGGAGGGGGGGEGGGGGGGGASGTACGAGGTGGTGGSGGTGSGGGSGGAGGAGGGAFAIKALGRLTVAGALLAQGGDGLAGTAGNSGATGATGSSGGKGHQSACGAGGTGGTGGQGGAGSVGGAGAGGGGGTIELYASVVEGFMSTIDTTGGNGGGAGGNGRFLLGQNNADPFTGTISGANLEMSHGWHNANPSLYGLAASPTLPDLVGGADSYGPTSLSTSGNFSTVVSSAPAGCPVALVRVHQGPAPYDTDFTGYDHLFFLNLSGTTLSSPQLGVGAFDYFAPLYQGGQDTNPIFQGKGRRPLTQWPADAVYATTIPAHPGLFNVSTIVAGTPYVLNGAHISRFVKVGNLQVLYLVPDHPASNVTSQVAIAPGTITKTGKGSYQQTVTITNTSTNTIVGPLALALDSLTAKVTLVNATGVTVTTKPAGSPYLDSAETPLAAGASVTLTLQFKAVNGRITYTARVLSGIGSR